MDYFRDMIGQIELHSIEGIRRCFDIGVSPNAMFIGAPLIDELTSEYTRSVRFKNCVKLFVDFGLEFEDSALLSVLLDDAGSLDKIANDNPSTVHSLRSLRCAYTPLREATLLHVCAEFNSLSCAKILMLHGADVNARAGIDNNGFGGQTPIFHAVNQNSNQSAEVMNYLLSASADLGVTVRGLIWGQGYEWETLIPAVNPISYAMMGLLPQMHRAERTTATVISTLLKHAYGIDYDPRNVPNKYLLH